MRHGYREESDITMDEVIRVGILFEREAGCILPFNSMTAVCLSSWFLAYQIDVDWRSSFICFDLDLSSPALDRLQSLIVWLVMQSDLSTPWFFSSRLLDGVVILQGTYSQERHTK